MSLPAIPLRSGGDDDLTPVITATARVGVNVFECVLNSHVIGARAPWRHAERECRRAAEWTARLAPVTVPKRPLTCDTPPLHCSTRKFVMIYDLLLPNLGTWI